MGTSQSAPALAARPTAEQTDTAAQLALTNVDDLFQDIPRGGQERATVVVLGATRIGKSTILNELFHNSVDAEVITKGPAEAQHQSDSVTKAAKLHWSPAQQMVLLDTVGLGDPEKTNIEIVREVLSVMNAFKGGVTAVLLVIKFDRWKAEDEANMQLLLELIPKEGLAQHAAIVFTHFPSKGCTDQAARVDRWAKDCPELQTLLQRIPTYFCVNNCVSGRAILQDEPSRAAFLKSVVAFVSSRGSTLQLRPGAWKQFMLYVLDLMGRIWRRLFGKSQSPWEVLVGLQVDVLLAARDAGRELLKSATAGPCSFCQEVVGLHQACYLSCNHPLHPACFELLQQQQSYSAIDCPSCGRRHHSVAAVTYDLSGLFHDV